MTDAARTHRAKQIAASIGPLAAASTKGGVVRFGMAAHLGRPVVKLALAEFDARTDDEVAERLRRAWE